MIQTILSPQLPAPARDQRQIFVAYPYTLYPKEDYRPVFQRLAKAFKVRFLFADEKITSLHILQKIADMIRSSRFGIYDISGWNPNVTLELGLAFGLGEIPFIAIDPSRTKMEDVPADLRGMDQMRYGSYSELEDRVEALLAQEVPVSKTHDAEDQLRQLRKQATSIVRDSDGLKITDIAGVLGISVDLAKVVVKPLVDKSLRIEGIKRGAKYYPIRRRR